MATTTAEKEVPARLAGLTRAELLALDAKLDKLLNERPDVVGWTVEEVAARLRLRPDTARRLCRLGVIQSVKVSGKVYRVHPRDLEDYLLRRRPAGRPRKPPASAGNIPAARAARA